MKIYLKIEDGIITKATFETFGCGSAIASSSMATVLITGKPLSQALALTNEAVAEALDGLPEKKLHCSVLAEQAVRAAVRDYYDRNHIPLRPGGTAGIRRGLKATPHKARLTALHAICLLIFRHIAQKSLDIRQYACEISMQSAEKSGFASYAQALCGVA